MLLWDFDVIDGATVDTNQVMVMTAEPLCELVPGEAFGSVVWGEDPCFFEHGQ